MATNYLKISGHLGFNGETKIKDFLENSGIGVKEVSKYRDSILRIISEEEIDIGKVIEFLKKTFIDLIRLNPGNALNEIQSFYYILQNLGNIEDNTAEENKRNNVISNYLRLLTSYSQESNLGNISLTKKGDNNYEVTLLHPFNYQNEEYKIQYTYYFSTDTCNYKTSFKVLKDGEDIQNEYDFIDQYKYIFTLDFLDVLKFVSGEIQTLEIREEDNEEIQIKKGEIPLDTILEYLPDISIIKKMKFSSIDGLRNQLDKWEIPYQFLTYSHGKKQIYSMDEEREEIPSILVCSGEIQEEIIKKNTDNTFSFSCYPSKENDSFYFIIEIGGTTKKYQITPQKEKEVIIPSQLIIFIGLNYQEKSRNNLIEYLEKIKKDPEKYFKQIPNFPNTYTIKHGLNIEKELEKIKNEIKKDNNTNTPNTLKNGIKPPIIYYSIQVVFSIPSGNHTNPEMTNISLEKWQENYKHGMKWSNLLKLFGDSFKLSI